MKKWVKPVLAIYIMTFISVSILLWIIKNRFDMIFVFLGFKGLFIIGSAISIIIGLIISKIILDCED